MNEPQNFLLPAEIRTALLQYLMDRPFKEVAAGVAMLQGLKPVEEKKDDAKKEG